jgi:transaldolase
LIGPHTVNTRPRETIDAFDDHGRVRDTLRSDVDEARRTFERFAEAGVDYQEVVAVLEREGVDKFADSFAELLDGIREKQDRLVATGVRA